jgi:hypothetical protein
LGASPDAFHVLTVLSRPQVTIRPSWVNAADITPPGWAFQVLTWLPLPMSHSLTDASWLAEIRTLESSRNMSDVTASLCPARL